MREGELFADRFEVRRIAGKGGMSIVYRATDRASGDPVAVKVLRASESELTSARFAREGRVLAELRHPGVVKYVDHGTTADGEHFLAIEWLEGEDLARRLRRAPMTIPECITLAKRVAQALGYAHQRGILHRDVKPSNIFLRRGRVEGAKILDFGIARMRGAEAEITAVGTRLGTPAYMSPEQARGVGALDARTDVFSLGCVLFQCLTRRRPFFGTDPTTVIAKILLEDAPPARALRPEVPLLLDNLLTQMLAKTPSRRPNDGAVVAEELAAIPLEDFPDSAQSPRRPSVLTSRERRLHSVVMIRGLATANEGNRIDSLVAFYGGRVAGLPDGVSVVTLSGTEAATDLAAKAARCALAIHDLAPKAAIALATGRDILRAERATMGPVLDRAAQLLRGADLTPPTREIGARWTESSSANLATVSSVRAEDDDDVEAVPSSRAETDPTVVGELPAPAHEMIRLDDVTAGLLDTRFEVSSQGGGFLLLGERLQAETTRTLLAKPTQCVAREAELGTLQAAFDAAVEEPEAHALLVTAAAGVGKSRLRYELVRRLEARGVRFQLLMGRGDPLSAGAPFGVLASAIRRAAELCDGEPAEALQVKLRARLSRHLPSSTAPRIVEFLGEMVGVPFSDANSVQLRAARQDALLMGDQMRRAGEDWLIAECRANPTILVLEDLHWGDLPTVSFVDSALRTLADAPFLVLALARNEVEELFPRMWSERGVQHIRLGTLSKKACRKLATQALGDSVDDETIERIVERSAGNAFYLEELIRAAAEGDPGQAPKTVLAMLQARLEKMEPDARRVLRAASVFGRTFWRDGVATLLGNQDEELDLDGWLSALAEREVIKWRAGAEFPADTEYAFRHDLVREASYTMLTDPDRAVGHALAGAWLEKRGESEPAVLAEHFERGNLPERAATCYQRAAEQAMAGNDFMAAHNRAERGVSCGAAGEALGCLRLLQAEALNWMGEFREAVIAAREAKSFLQERTDGWYAAIGEIATAAGAQGDTDQLSDLVVALGEPEARSDDRRFVRASTRLAEQLLATGLVAKADRLLNAVDGRADELDREHPGLTARIHAAKASRACFDGNAGKNLEYVEAATERFEQAGDLRNACQLRARAGYARMDLGAYEEAKTALRDALASAARIGLHDVAARAKQSLGVTLGLLGNPEEASRIQVQAAEEFAASGNRRMHSAACAYLALIRLECDDADDAERQAKRALDLAETPTLLRFAKAFALAALARVMLARGNNTEAIDAATASMRILEEAGGIDEGESIIRLTYAEALQAVGDREAALDAIRAARERLHARANRISPHWRTSFLYNTPAHADTLRLAEEWAEARA